MEDPHSQNNADKCFGRLGFSPHTVLTLSKIRVCDLFHCCCMKTACCSITKCLQPKASYLPPLLSTHLTCDLHQHSEAITHGGAQTHTLPAGAPQGLDVTGSCQSPTLMQTAFFTQVRLSKHTLTLL